jgi:hypothetical protein
MTTGQGWSSLCSATRCDLLELLVADYRQPALFTTLVIFRAVRDDLPLTAALGKEDSTCQSPESCIF